MKCGLDRTVESINSEYTQHYRREPSGETTLRRVRSNAHTLLLRRHKVALSPCKGMELQARGGDALVGLLPRAALPPDQRRSMGSGCSSASSVKLRCQSTYRSCEGSLAWECLLLTTLTSSEVVQEASVGQEEPEREHTSHDPPHLYDSQSISLANESVSLDSVAPRCTGVSRCSFVIHVSGCPL